MPGPNKKSPNLKVLQGNPGDKPPQNPVLPKKPRVRYPAPPTGLNRDGAREWRRTCVQLREMGMLFDADRTILHAYCAAYQRWVGATKELDEWLEKDGAKLTVLSANKMIQVHPIVGMIEKSEATMTRHLERMGLTPTSRANIGVTPKATGDDVKQKAAEFLYGA